jgi:hypothetical protein
VSEPPRPAEPPRSDGAWQDAREKAREDVVAALAPRHRVCPHCGSRDPGPGRRCNACGRDLVIRRSRRPKPRTIAAAVFVLACLAGAGGVAVSALRDEAREERQAARERQAQLVAAERRRLRADSRPHRAQLTAASTGVSLGQRRRKLVRGIERLITRDARARVADGRLDGPVIGAECGPHPKTPTRRALELDPGTTMLGYDCVALKSRFELPPAEGRGREGLFGYPYRAVIDHERASVAFCKVTPRAGEGGSSLASVPVPAPCRDPLRR